MTDTVALASAGALAPSLEDARPFEEPPLSGAAPARGAGDAGRGGLPTAPLVLHVHPTFGRGEASSRALRLINAFGPAFRHRVVALDGRFDALEALGPGVECRPLPPPGPAVRWGPLNGRAGARRVLREIRPSVLVTQGWGTIGWALANRWPASCPHVHVEDGSDAAGGFERRSGFRARLRRLALSGDRCKVVVPSRGLERVALERWRLDPGRVVYLPDGVDAARFKPARRRARPGPALAVGALGELRREKRLDRLLRAVAGLDDPDVQLWLIGDGPERVRLEQLARALGVADRVLFLGRARRPEAVLPKLDVFALPSDAERMPSSLLEAMACGLPVACTDVGDVKLALSAKNRPLATRPGDDAAFAAALRCLLRDEDLRRILGAANRRRALETWSRARNERAWQRLWQGG